MIYINLYRKHFAKMRVSYPKRNYATPKSIFFEHGIAQLGCCACIGSVANDS